MKHRFSEKTVYTALRQLYDAGISYNEYADAARNIKYDNNGAYIWPGLGSGTGTDKLIKQCAIVEKETGIEHTANTKSS